MPVQITFSFNIIATNPIALCKIDSRHCKEERKEEKEKYIYIRTSWKQ